ncbi:MAG: hypothetical protein HY691_11815 [Chloroflexi bacterium]|nr:hypothetical protein [Chloroflexota bacterium]
MTQTHELAFETVIEAHLLAHRYAAVNRDGFVRERANFPDTVLAFTHNTGPKERGMREALHAHMSGEQTLEDQCKWIDVSDALATWRRGLKRHARTLQVAFLVAARGLTSSGRRATP